MNILEKRKFGNTGRAVFPIGISTSFGAEKEVYEEAFELGCNYFTWGTFIKGRSAPFKAFMREKSVAQKREELFIGLLSYSHSAILGDMFLNSARKRLQTDYVDGLILGYYPKRPPQRVLDWALEKKHRGVIKYIGLTTHNRAVVAPLVKEGILDYYHIRYNAVHRGAENDIFPHTRDGGPGIVSFTATCWGKLFKPKNLPDGARTPDAADCYRFVLARDEIHCCMMGVKNRQMLQENMQGLQRGAMTEEEVANMIAVGNSIYRK